MGSAIARKVKFGGPSYTGNLPQITVIDQNGTLVKTNYFGGNIKGGAPSSIYNRKSIYNVTRGAKKPASRPNFNFKFRTQLGPSPFGFTSL